MSHVVRFRVSIEETRIVSTLHMYLDPRHYLDVLVLRMKEMKAITDPLIRIRGVKHGVFSATAKGKVLA